MSGAIGVLVGVLCLLAILYFAIRMRMKDSEKAIQAWSAIVTALFTAVVSALAFVQYHDSARKESIERTANWGQLRNTMWSVMELGPPQGLHVLRTFPKEERVKYMRQVKKLLDQEIRNPVLIENRSCLGHWRNAISATMNCELYLSDDERMVDQFESSAGGILKDVAFVWEKLVLDSNEVSPTGGIPEEKEKSNGTRPQ